MKKLQLINVDGHWYNVLGIYDGTCYLGKPTDIFNETVKQGVLWEMSPFFYSHEKWYGKIIVHFTSLLRHSKTVLHLFIHQNKKTTYGT